MNTIRTIKKIITGQNAVDGAGVKLVREFGHHDTLDFDPFLLLDAFDSGNPQDYIKGFPWHPHRGIETVTYLIEGDIAHGDSLGNKGNILAGDCQWMTAGSGIIHQEMPQAMPRLLGAQLWINLPAKNKMTEPQYRSITKNEIPLIEEPNGTIRIVCGQYKGTKGATEGDFVKALYLDVELKAERTWELETPNDHTLFIYIFRGEALFGEENNKAVPEKHVILFNDGNMFKVKALEKGIRFLLVSGPKLNEPIAWGGPIVMNTREELNLAFEELDNNSFIRHKIKMD